MGSAEKMASLYGNLKKLEDDEVLELDGYMSTYKDFEPVCNMLGMNENMLKNFDDTIKKADAAITKKARKKQTRNSSIFSRRS